MLMYNINVADKLNNGSMGTVAYLHINPRDFLTGSIYIKFDDENAGKSMKNRRSREELNDCVPISAIAQPFPFSSYYCSTKAVSITISSCHYSA